MIPYGHQLIDGDDIEAVVEALKSDWLTQGPAVKEFEANLAAFCGTKYAVVVNSGTAALHCAYFAAGIEAGDEIIMPAQTFVATANAASYLGAKPVFCDIDLDTYNIDVKKIEELITKKTKAIVPVHIAGEPCQMAEILAIAKKHNLLVIEDACHAFGARYKNKKIGSLSDMTVFSFHPVKSITTGEGGAICTDSEQYYKAMCMFRTHGVVNDDRMEKKDEGPWYFEMQSLGFNYRLTDIQSALGIAQLAKVDDFVAKRRALAEYYNESLKEAADIILPKFNKDNTSSWHLYIVRVAKNLRKGIFIKLRESGVGVQVHYVPVYHHPYYQKIGYGDLNLPNTEIYYETCMSLPLYPSLKKDEQDFVIARIKELLVM